MTARTPQSAPVKPGALALDHDGAMLAFANAEGSESAFGLTAAMRRAAQAVAVGRISESDGMSFAEWLLKTHDGETAGYVDALETSILRDRFLESTARS
jgi:hypothetical protein